MRNTQLSSVLKKQKAENNILKKDKVVGKTKQVIEAD